MFNKVSHNFQLGNHNVLLETGEIARQASGAVLVTVDDTIVLATVVGAQTAKEGQDFFPLTVDYIEKTYAAGRIPGGFFKREGKPSEKETLTSRLIDRPLRPLFPEGFYNEVQIVIHVLSVNPEVDPDIPALIGASAALAISGIPFNGPMGATRVGLINGQFVLNPATSTLAQSTLDLVVAGTDEAVLMVESEAHELGEEQMLEAIVFGHTELKKIIEAIKELAKQVAKPAWDWAPAPKNIELQQKITAIAETQLKAAYAIREKQARSTTIKKIVTSTIAQLKADSGADSSLNEVEINNLIFDLEAKIVRSQILSGELRIDGRDTRTVRPISIRTGILPRTHGSALFTRGETQALAVATLGTSRDEQKIDALTGEYNDRFMMHYNMPPFATGETGRVGTPKRREIGHGRLAKRALIPVLPRVDQFSYSIRLVSEILESNGSSSMASVCGGCLALQDAGVPITAQVAGIAMGLILEGKRFAVLTDILGDEDHLGDMDFKVAGTKRGITALQMDIKIGGITKEIMQVALAQAHQGRLHILEKMQAAMPTGREELSAFAPRLITFSINPEKIRDVIGKGGSVIRALTEETKTQIDITDEGLVTIAAVDAEAGEFARKRIEDITAEVEVGKIYEGTVIKILEIGAVVQILPGKDGLVHISQISNERVKVVSDHLQMGQVVKVKALEVDEKGRVRLSMKAVAPPAE